MPSHENSLSFVSFRYKLNKKVKTEKKNIYIKNSLSLGLSAMNYD